MNSYQFNYRTILECVVLKCTFKSVLSKFQKNDLPSLTNECVVSSLTI